MEPGLLPGSARTAVSSSVSRGRRNSWQSSGWALSDAMPSHDPLGACHCPRVGPKKRAGGGVAADRCQGRAAPSAGAGRPPPPAARWHSGSGPHRSHAPPGIPPRPGSKRGLSAETVVWVPSSSSRVKSAACPRTRSRRGPPRRGSPPAKAPPDGVRCPGSGPSGQGGDSWTEAERISAPVSSRKGLFGAEQPDRAIIQASARRKREALFMGTISFLAQSACTSLDGGRRRRFLVPGQNTPVFGEKPLCGRDSL